MRSPVFPIITEQVRKLPFYVTGIGCFYDQEHMIRHIGHHDFLWIQSNRGKGKFIVEGTTYIVNENQGMLLYPSVPHEYYRLTRQWEVDWITFDGAQIRPFLRSIGLLKSSALSLSHPEIVRSTIRQALEANQQSSAVNAIQSAVYAYQLLLDLSIYGSINNESSKMHQYNKLDPVFSYVNQNYSEDLTLQSLAEKMNLTPQHLSSIFKKTVGLSLFEYITMIRIQKSKELLLIERNRQIKEIADMVGFNSVSYFCSVFKKHVRMTPNEFRRLYGDTSPPPGA